VGDSCFGTTGDQHIGFAIAYGFESISHGIVARGASGGDGEVWTTKPVLDRKISACGIEHHFGDRKGAHTIWPFGVESKVLFFDLVESTYT